MTEKQVRFLALGDSYTIGESVTESRRWPAHLVRMLRDQGVNIDQLTIIARTGWTTAELQVGIDQARPDPVYQLVSLLIGVNNQYRGLSRDEYQREFILLLEQAIGFAGDDLNHVLVISIPDWSVTPFADGRDRNQISAEIDAFNDINRQESKRLGVQYVDVTPLSRQAEADRSLVATDGLHPSGEMYTRWAELILPHARSILVDL
jgi:lysophospholipase L1-like esterase